MAIEFDQPAQVPILRVGTIVREAYAVWFANFRLWLKLLAVPVALIAGFSLLGWQLLRGQDGDITQAPSAAVIAVVAFAVVIFVAQIPMATAWHRLILMPADRASHRYRIGRPEGRYCLKMLVIVLIVLMVSLMIGLMLSFLVVPTMLSLTTGTGGVANPLVFWMAGIVIALGFYALLVYFLGYLLLMLPAAAMGRNCTSREAAAALGRNQWRLMGIYTLVLLPLVILEFLLAWLVGSLALQNGVLLAVVQYGPPLLFAPVVIGVLSIVYRELAQAPEVGMETTEVQ